MTPKAPDSLSSPADTDEIRREFLRNSLATAVALGLGPALSLAGTVAGTDDKLAGPSALQVLTADEAAIYDAWCEQLAPGAGQAGVSRYLDAQLAAPQTDAALLLRVLANPPFEAFYRQGIAGIEQEVREHFGGDATFLSLSDTQRREVIDAAAADATVAWKAPSPSFFYFVSRAAAVDVAFGTEAGFRRLGVPYLAHIRPPTPW